MKKLLSLIAALGLVCSVGLAHAAEGVFAPQRSHTAACSHEAGVLEGAQRAAFMKRCLRDKKVAQQHKAKACQRDAKGKKRAARKAFIQECMRHGR
jgi:membrane protease subunit (stomatin/prohibitin family)